MKLNIAVIGSGLTGLWVAYNLQERANITIFDKARGVGGRLSTRYAGDYEFDHGAPFFKASTSSFQQQVNHWIAQGVLSAWKPRILQKGEIATMDECYIGVPKMNALPKYLSRSLHLVLQTEIKQWVEQNHAYYLLDANAHYYGPFDWVIVTAPFPQAQSILYEEMAPFNVQMQSCYALMLGYSKSLELDWDVALDVKSCVSKMIINHQKPYRTSAPSVLALCELVSNQDLLDLREQMQQAVFEMISQKPCHIDSHFWRYARSNLQNTPQIYVNKDKHMIAGGDWSVDGTVEGAFLAAECIIQQMQEFL
jgi:renalase